MKKNTALLLAVIMSLSVTACGSQDNGGADVTEKENNAIYTEITENTSDIQAAPETFESAEETTVTVSEETEKSFACADIANEIMSSIEMSSMAEVGADRISMYLDCEIPDGCDFSMFICGSGGFADEIFVLDSDAVDTAALEAAVEKRIDSRKKDFEGYNPDEFEKLENFFVSDSNGYFIYTVTSNNELCESIFDKYVK